MIDTVKITIKAGDGGDGAVSFHREKFVTRGGPDGGDGGRGGSVYFVADNNTSTLDDFRSKKVFGAQNGEAGKKLKMYGKNGEDLFVKVPVGTLVFEVDSSWQAPQQFEERAVRSGTRYGEAVASAIMTGLLFCLNLKLL